jgi:hypothetical protein
MRWTSQASACLVAVVLAGCSGRRDNRTGNETGSTGDTSGMSSSSSDTSGMSGMSADTGMSGGRGTSTDTGSRSGMRSDTGSSRMRSDTGAGMRSDSAKANQTKSGVTDTKTGKSTLGPGVTKTRPDQGQPVTSNGDTLSPGADSAAQR